jgi:hypothetical protein
MLSGSLSPHQLITARAGSGAPMDVLELIDRLHDLVHDTKHIP